MPYKDLERRREYMRKYHKTHHVDKSEYNKSLYEKEKEFLGKFGKVDSYCRYHNLLIPHRKREIWKDGQIRRIGRTANGKFITWKVIVDE